MELRNLDFYPRCHFRSTKLRVGKGTVINSDCHFDNDDWKDLRGARTGTRERRAGGLRLAPVVVGHGAWIGAGAVIFPASRSAMVVSSARAPCVDDCAPDGLYGGVPAKRIGQQPADRADGSTVAG